MSVEEQPTGVRAAVYSALGLVLLHYKMILAEKAKIDEPPDVRSALQTA